MRWVPVAAITLGAVTAGLIARGIANTRQLSVSRETVAIPELPDAFAGFSLLHLTDLHLRTVSRWPERLLTLARDLAPDCVCLTGDYIVQRGAYPKLTAFLTALAAVVPRCFAVFGNADYREPLLTMAQRRELTRTVSFLRNASATITRGSQQLWFAGVEDPHDEYADLEAALANVPSAAPVLLLAHSPEIITDALDPRIRLILSGHTHGGQICLPGGFAPYTNMRLPRRFVAGRHQVGNAVLYVSRGIGSTRLRMRFNCSPEATLFTLTRSG
ncbi:MAG: phosphodiesterase YaeI [bacterium ADurb.Bin429]|nr:MAG: phosphodiesterase YaeI [bacterium ADurb.Bin429]